ncbi:MAG: hypothetical protein JJT89_16000 [Nitriliruptoraceae bacterium]|nr:hypothetical protein [Nitriliruptoraceae bacterium]
MHRLDDGTACYRVRLILLNGREPSEVLSRYNTQFFLAMERVADPGSVGLCPGDPADPAGAEDPPVGEPEVVLTFVQEVTPPEPRIVPGYMITGMVAYLETGRDLTIEETVDAGPPGLPVLVELRATGSYTVEWGDGTVTGPHDTPGGPWPDGDVTHTYERADTVDIVVRDTWELQWRFAGSELWSVPLTLELDPVVLDTFEVQEYRAVRVRP